MSSMLVLGMNFLVIDVLSRVLHVGTAVTLVGGSLFMAAVLMPSVIKLDEDSRSSLMDNVRGRWKRFVHTGIGLFLITGFYNYFRAMPNHKGDGLYHAFVGTKIIMALFVFFLASVLVGRSPKFEGWRQNPMGILRLMLTLSAAIILMSGFLKIRGV